MDIRDRWSEISRLYHAALEQPEDRRPGFVTEVCGGDTDLRREVQSLLNWHSDAATFMGESADAAAGPSLIGRQLGAYRIDAPLGAGGMGEVYRATDVRLHRPVAVKILPPHVRANPERRWQFEQEARAVAALAHPHICVLHDIGREDTIEFLVLEHLEGETLAARLAGGPLPRHEAFRYAIQIADALAETHTRGIVHRDLKPANIMLTAAGAKLLDFGLATLQPDRDGGGGSTLAPGGFARIAGTLAYMAPEQLAGGATDARADIFAFGVILYEMVTGSRPFAGAVRTVPGMRGVRPRLLRRIVRRCLSLEPERRYSSASALADALRTAARLQPLARPFTFARLMTLAVVSLLIWVLGPYLAVAGTAPLAGDVSRLVAIVAIVAFGLASAVWRWQQWHQRRIPLSGVALLLALTGAASLWWAWVTTPTARPAPPVLTEAREAGPAPLRDVRQIVGTRGNITSPAISRDGRYTAYVMPDAGGRFALIVRSEADGRTTEVLRSSAVIADPRWSPDGARLLYLAPAGAFVVPRQGGVPERIDRGLPRWPGYSSRLWVSAGLSAAAWAPDGTRVAIASGGSLFVVSLRGGSHQTIVRDYQRELHSCDWAPGAESIACVAGAPLDTLTGRRFSEPPLEPGSSAIVLVSAQGGAPQPLTPGSGVHLSPLWATDGTRLYFVADREGVRDVYSLPMPRRSGASGRPRRETVGLRPMAISLSDEGRMAYSTLAVSTNLWSVPVRAEPTTLGDARPATVGEQTVEAVLQGEDGASLVYTARRSGERGVYRLSLDGGATEQISSVPLSRPPGVLEGASPAAMYGHFSATSRDGRWVAYANPRAPGIVVVDRVRQVEVTRLEGAGWPAAWLRDEQSLVFASNRQVSTYTPATGVTRILYDGGSLDPDEVTFAAVVSDDESQIAMTTYDWSRKELVFSRMPSGGSDGPVPMLRIPAARLVPWLSPTLTFALVRNRLYFTREEHDSGIWVGDMTTAHEP